MEQTVAQRERALALTPSGRISDEVAGFTPDGWATLDTSDGRWLDRFSKASDTILVLANRYDGIDLPGDLCEIVLIHGLPTGTHLQERFLYETAGGQVALRERMRTRLLQGMGRATRSRSDRAVVVLSRQDLIDFVRDPGNLVGLRAEAQAEIQYGLYLAAEEEPLEGLVETFLEGGEEWEAAEDHLREVADEADLSAPAGASDLARSAPWEVRAIEAAWRGDMEAATAHALTAVRALTSSAVGGYRTLWKVLAAHWATAYAQETGDKLAIRQGSELARDAAASAQVRAWRPPLPNEVHDAQADAMDSRGARAASRLVPLARSPRVDVYVARLVSSLQSRDAKTFERGIEQLGHMLGFDSVRPGGSAAPDGAWRDGAITLLWEAKSEQLGGGRNHGKAGASGDHTSHVGKKPTRLGGVVDCSSHARLASHRRLRRCRGRGLSHQERPREPPWRPPRVSRARQGAADH